MGVDPFAQWRPALLTLDRAPWAASTSMEARPGRLVVRRGRSTQVVDVSGCTLRAVPPGPQGGPGALTVLVAPGGEVSAAVDLRDWEVLPGDPAASRRRAADLRARLGRALAVPESSEGWRRDVGPVLDPVDRRGMRRALAVQLGLALVTAVCVVVAVAGDRADVAVGGASAYLLLLVLAYRPRRRRPPARQREWVVGGLWTPQVSGVDEGRRLYVWDPVAGRAGHVALDPRARVVVHRSGLQIVRRGSVLLDATSAQWGSERLSALRRRLSASLAVEDGNPLPVVAVPQLVGPSRPPRPYEAGMAAVLGVGFAAVSPGPYAQALFGLAAVAAGLFAVWWAQVVRARSAA
ncbi:hypothetical protein [Mumia zhuanghuii]|uniref:Uncharacterized protein n=1 Tax=Mumia zhuanghuii TaxID=2585211 RepID=A0A5C4MBI6_9ACTN|nr:hypothetical protein [Mumia zhuanghuii]TNC34393.1 hypothetical protein FHE65_27870 [Mumia zhuanghuii]TNC38336.1 hypothetical protein FHE65_24415 [Mumia zhuanghuii]